MGDALYTREQFRGLRLDQDVRELGPEWLLDSNGCVLRGGVLVEAPGLDLLHASGLLPVGERAFAGLYGHAPQRRYIAFAGYGGGPASFQLKVWSATNSAQQAIGGQPGDIFRFSAANPQRDVLLCMRAMGSGNPYVYTFATNAFAAMPSVTVDGVGGKTFPRLPYGCQSPLDYRVLCWGPQNPPSGTLAGPGGATHYDSRVWASEPADYTVWKTTSTFELTPNDGEQIQGSWGVWNGELYLFKQSRMFILRSMGSLANGAPVFNLQEVPLGFNATGLQCCTTPFGLVLASTAGVYITDGGIPRKISGAIDPLFEQSYDAADPVLSLLEWSQQVDYVCSVAYVDGRLYLATRGPTAAFHLFEYDFGADSWMHVGMQGNDFYLLASQPVPEAGYIGGRLWVVSGSGQIRQFASGSTDGVSSYGVMFSPLAMATEGVCRQTLVTLDGLSLTADPQLYFKRQVGPGAGTPPAPLRGSGDVRRFRRAERGSLLVPVLTAAAPAQLRIRRVAHDVWTRDELGDAVG